MSESPNLERQMRSLKRWLVGLVGIALGVLVFHGALVGLVFGVFAPIEYTTHSEARLTPHVVLLEAIWRETDAWVNSHNGAREMLDAIDRGDRDEAQKMLDEFTERAEIPPSVQAWLQVKINQAWLWSG